MYFIDVLMVAVVLAIPTQRFMKTMLLAFYGACSIDEPRFRLLNFFFKAYYGNLLSLRWLGDRSHKYTY